MYARVRALITFKLKEIIRLIRAWAYRVYMESIDLGLGQCMINVYVYPFMRACVRVFYIYVYICIETIKKYCNANHLKNAYTCMFGGRQRSHEISFDINAQYECAAKCEHVLHAGS